MNWRASLRLGELYVTQHHRERNADVVLMLDTLAEVGRAPETTLDWSVRAAASLATAYLARKDRVGLINYGGLIHWVKPAGGRAQYERLVDALARAAVVFTYVAKDLAVVPPRVLPPRAVVIGDHAAARRALRAGRARPGRARLRPGRPRRLARRRHARRAACRRRSPTSPAGSGRSSAARALAELHRQGIPVLEWQPPEPLELALARARRRRPRLVAAG